MNENQTVVEFCYTVDILKTGEDLLGVDEMGLGVFEDTADCVGHERDRAAICARNNKLVGQRDLPLWQTKSFAYVDDRNDASLDVDDPEYDFWRIGKWGEIYGANDAFNRG